MMPIWDPSPMTIIASGLLWQIARCRGASPGILLQMMLAPRATTEENPLQRQETKGGRGEARHGGGCGCTPLGRLGQVPPASSRLFPLPLPSPCLSLRSPSRDKEHVGSCQNGTQLPHSSMKAQATAVRARARAAGRGGFASRPADGARAKVRAPCPWPRRLPRSRAHLARPGDAAGPEGDPTGPAVSPRWPRGTGGGGSSEVASGRWLREPAGTRAAAVPRAGHGEGATDSPGCPPQLPGVPPKPGCPPAPRCPPRRGHASPGPPCPAEAAPPRVGEARGLYLSLKK